MLHNSNRKKLVLAVTGGFGTGKTTVTKMFERMGAVVIDADRIYHQILESKGTVYKKIVSVFGEKILTDGQQINKKKLAKLVFSEKKLLQILSRITHPDIIDIIKNRLTRLKAGKGHKVIVLEVPLLIEADLMKMANRLIVVKTNQKKQIARCKKHLRLTKEEIVKRIESQVPLAKKIKLADYVIDNNGMLRQTREQVRKIWRQERKRRKRWR